jgi:hypothetical protein
MAAKSGIFRPFGAGKSRYWSNHERRQGETARIARTDGKLSDEQVDRVRDLHCAHHDEFYGRGGTLLTASNSEAASRPSKGPADN